MYPNVHLERVLWRELWRKNFLEHVDVNFLLELVSKLIPFYFERKPVVILADLVLEPLEVRVEVFNDFVKVGRDLAESHITNFHFCGEVLHHPGVSFDFMHSDLNLITVRLELCLDKALEVTNF
jgi:hypothetical protein